MVNPMDKNDEDNDDDPSMPSPPSPPPSFISRQLSLVWIFLVNSVADFVAAILSHPNVQDKVNLLLVRAVTSLLDDPTLVEQLDAATRSYTHDLSRHSEAARHIWENVPKLMSGFMGGLLSNVTVSRTSTRSSGSRSGSSNEGSKAIAKKGTTNTVTSRHMCDESIEQLYFDDPKKDK